MWSQFLVQIFKRQNFLYFLQINTLKDLLQDLGSFFLNFCFCQKLATVKQIVDWQNAKNQLLH